MREPIIVLCYARSGGTILNKCLSSFSNTVVMSEVNPVGGGSGGQKGKVLDNIRDQAEEWYGIKLTSNTFTEQVEELNTICHSRNQFLILRDWSIVDFEPLSHNKKKPKNSFSIINELHHLKPTLIGFVRDSIDVWISRGQPEVEPFFMAYQSYIDNLCALNIPIFKYEDFVRNPELTLKSICIEIGIEYEDVLNNAPNYDKVNGDIQRGSNSRGEINSSIKPLSRQIIPYSKVKELNRNKRMKKINEKFDYETNYFDGVAAPIYFLKRIGQFYHRQISSYGSD